MPAPLKTYKSGNFDVSLWKNEKDMNEGGIVAFKTLNLRKTWRDRNNTSRQQSLSLRVQDIEKVMVLLRKIQGDILLEE